MRPASTPTAIGLALYVAATASHAIGFGRIVNNTQLGQPLNFSASVHLEADEALPRECVSAEVQSGENKLQPQQIRVTLEGNAASADRSVRVTTSALIDEPVVTVSVTVGCNSKVTRRFVAFIDPPLIDAPRTAQIDPPLAPQRVDSQVAPIVTLVQGEGPSPSELAAERAAARTRARGPVPITSGAATRAARAPRAVPPANPAPRSAAVSRQIHRAPAASGPRLQLDTAPTVVALASAAAASTAGTPVPPAAAPLPLTSASAPLAPASGVAAAASAAAGPDTAALEQARIQTLEQGMARMRSQAQATQASVAALQARLDRAESERYANPMVYALAWLSALLALALAGLWWRQSRGRQATQWWAGPTAAPAPSSVRLAAAPPEPIVSAPQPLGAVVTAADAFDVSTVVEDEPVPPTQASFSTRPAPFVSHQLSPVTMAPELPRELSVEELIDLEQQAEFFIVLGQDEAAIELLMSHVRSDGGISPLPYLKLLEIYRRRGDDEAYQRIRERFNRRFNSYAPDWDADLQQGRSLVDYPDTVARLQTLWASPVRVMETLDASLFRRNRTDETFDLPAYRELLFLYSVARDLAEHAGALPATSVDLLLPMDDGDAEPIERLSATTMSGEFQNSDMMTMPLDLDVSFGPGHPVDAETMPSALRRADEHRSASDSNFIDFDLDAPAPAKPRAGGKG